MEKLRQQDAASGAETTALSKAQTDAIAEARRAYEAQVAECRILHESALATAVDPDARAQLEANYRRDLSRFASDRDRRIKKIREDGV
jgi:hypothetical protein